MRPTQVSIPSFVRTKPGALDRLGIYASRHKHERVCVVASEGMVPSLLERACTSLREQGATRVDHVEASDASFESVGNLLAGLPSDCQAVIGLGGGKALDVAKYLAHLSKKPYYAVPTSLSNDGFCSPQSSLTLKGRRVSLSASLPFAVVVDTAVCLAAPETLWLSGVGDLIAKITAEFDWKLAYRQKGEPVDDLAVLLSDATVNQFLASPTKDQAGAKLLATSLLLNGIAMEISGSSRPASGSEHLISHALDQLSKRPRLHGLQVGVATYLVSRLQRSGTERIAQVLDQTSFWQAIQDDPFDRQEWLAAIKLAPTIKSDRFTILSTRDCVSEVASIINEDSRLKLCFV